MAKPESIEDPAKALLHQLTKLCHEVRSYQGQTEGCGINVPAADILAAETLGRTYKRGYDDGWRDATGHFRKESPDET